MGCSKGVLQSGHANYKQHDLTLSDLSKIRVLATRSKS